MAGSKPADQGERRLELDGRAVWICVLSLLVGIAAGYAARFLTGLVAFFTNLAYFHRFSWTQVNPWDHAEGWMAVLIPVLGGLIVGLMAKHGSKGIRGHGIPEAMEQVLFNRSKIQPRLMFLKPLSAAVAIGTGGPFGLEGPIIATGGAMGSVLGQWMPSTPDERKTLLGAGAAAGMAATFGSPISAVLLAVELLLFEYRSRSFIPVALAASAATAVRVAMVGPEAAFPMTDLSPAGPMALVLCAVVGAAAGALSAPVTRTLFAMEDSFFSKLRVHWALWPAIGGLAVGLIGLAVPRTLGVGYDNITQILSGSITGWAVIALCVAKFISWSVALGSGTSGGTLAPLFTVGGGFGAALGLGLAHLFPWAGLDPRMAALVGMAALFTGASRAMLTSVVFAVEATRQPWGILPLLAGCAVAYLVSSRLMTTNIMTDRMIRRGARVPSGLGTDPLDQILVAERCSREPAVLPADMRVHEARAWLHSGEPGSTHRAFPLLEPDGKLVGLISRSRLLEAEGDQPIRDYARAPVRVPPFRTLREAGNLMAEARADVLIVAEPEHPDRMLGVLTLRDLLEARNAHVDSAALREPAFEIMPGTQVFRSK